MLRRGVLVAGTLPRLSSLRQMRPFTTSRHLLSNSKVDVLIIGSGAGSLTAALRAKHHNLRVAVIEKQPTIGGASAISGGGLWIPNNPVSNVKDSKQDASEYFDQAVGDVGPASSPARRHAYLDNAPKMIAFLQEEGF
ncbi:3-oxosteroid 1-dehydrogenase [Colletotrichum kahawae]|uniref:3-oxosteroid 1-dehydrogenase n=1 Tax=Colletotrichum kahawae TaxID=34407 RepID=A0AAD9Y3H7_COLKA|nr:3-oxosteroid 1-dehydrogenase [Colletotrichum kahawae]